MRQHRILFAMCTPLFLGACSNEGSGTRTGQMELRLVDAPADEVKEIVVTINKVTVHVAGEGWSTLANETHTVDLLKLQGGAFSVLGVTEIPAGKITQFRLYTDETAPNYVTLPDGKQVPLKVPSGPQSGIKVKWGDVALPPCATGQITVDFDGKKSLHVHPTGREDQWILRPVVRLKSVSFTGGTCPGETPPVTGEPTPVVPQPPTTPPTPPSAPPADSCEKVDCGESGFCSNGTCQRLIE